MDEPPRDRDPESYFGAGIGGGSGLFTTGGGAPDGPRALDVEELRKELRRQGAFLHEP
jgi:hypothetical protein